MISILCIQKMRIAFQWPECAPSTREHSSSHPQKVKRSFMLKPFICEATAGVTSSIGLRTQKHTNPYSVFGWLRLLMQIVSSKLTPSFCKHQEKWCVLGEFITSIFRHLVLRLLLPVINPYERGLFVSVWDPKLSQQSWSSIICSPQHCTCIKIMAQHKSGPKIPNRSKLYIDIFLFMFNNLVHLLWLMKSTLYLTCSLSY